MKTDVIKQIRDIGVIPVVRASTADEAMRAIDAIREGGISVLEITMTVPGAVKVDEEGREALWERCGRGGGDVLDPETATSCVSRAQFVVSPALNLETIACCQAAGYRGDAGCVDADGGGPGVECGRGFCEGVSPAGAVGGASYLKALKAPFRRSSSCRLVASRSDRMGDFIRAGAAALGVGADLVDINAIRDGKPR